MNNANKPITPLQSMGYPSHESVIKDEYLIGLTKREYFAAIAMQGLLSASTKDDLIHTLEKKIPRVAVNAADELLKILDETEKK